MVLNSTSLFQLSTGPARVLRDWLGLRLTGLCETRDVFPVLFSKLCSGLLGSGCRERFGLNVKKPMGWLAGKAIQNAAARREELRAAAREGLIRKQLCAGYALPA